MGDRGIAVLRFPKEYEADLAVYSHWTGSSLQTQVSDIANSPSFQSRLGDVSYAARIMVDQLTKDARDEETGYGVFPVVKRAVPTDFSDGKVEVAIDLTTGEVTWE